MQSSVPDASDKSPGRSSVSRTDRWLGALLPGGSRSRQVRLLVAVVLAAAAAGLQWCIQPWAGPRIPFLFFIPAIVIAAVTIGRAHALFVLATGVVNAAYLLEPAATIAVHAPADRFAILVFAAVSLLVIGISGRLRVISQLALDAQRRLRLVQESVGVGLFEIDLATRTLSASPGLRDLLDVPMGAPDAVMADFLLGIYAIPPDANPSRPLHREHEHRISCPDGTVRWTLSKVDVEFDDGKPRWLRGAVIDISERKRLDLALRAARDHLEQQVDDLQRLHDLSGHLLELPDLRSELTAILRALAAFHGCRKGVVALVDPGGTHLSVCASLGLPDEQLLELSNAHPFDGIGGAVLATKARSIVADTQTDAHAAGYRSIARACGFRALCSTPLLTLDGAAIGVITLYFDVPRVPDARETRLGDICARKAAVYVERALARASVEAEQQRFELVLEASAVPFNVLTPVRDEAGQVIDFRWDYVNAAAAKTLRRAAADLVNRPVTDEYPDCWRIPGLFEHLTAVADHAQVREFELAVDLSGASVWFHVIASPLPGAVAVWYADVTEHRRQELALQEADRRKDEFLAVLAHELRNPLAPIRQATAVAKAGHASPSQQRWSLDVIERQVRHMALLLDDLLDVSRITRGILQLRLVPTDLAGIVDAAVETVRPLIESRQHRLTVTLPPYPLQVTVDSLRLAQVLSNLLANAAKYTDTHGAIRIEVSHTDHELAISVIDTGVGLAAEDLQRVFQMFAQVGSAADRSQGGWASAWPSPGGWWSSTAARSRRRAKGPIAVRASPSVSRASPLSCRCRKSRCRPTTAPTVRATC
ncbi:ATP-binding protein [Tahibacter amnicola]|uniref:histidine kinase n=1 Tax=Tahibacter amnicola TaxID=2976241 RepID=A0ABY6BNC4_9GAMM|nr:histidine kinase dimerization/phospho-acceptor domain-containing protein [Tahibacter amnicola]UXI69312.1 ATP-binding protein [Tahibacter amnicola]